jgi:hypothetical protein
VSYQPANLPLSVFFRYRGDNAALAMTLTDPDTGLPFNPTGWVLIFTAKANAADPDSSAVIQKISTTGGFTTTNASQGLVTLSLVPAYYASVKSLKTYQIDVQAQNSGSGLVKTVLRGTFLAETDITQETTLSIPTYTTNPQPATTSFQSVVLTGIASSGANPSVVCGIETLETLPAGAVLRVLFPGHIVCEFQLESATVAVANFLFQPYDFDAEANPVMWRLNKVHRLGAPCVWNNDTGKWHDLYGAGLANAVTLGADQTGFSLPA